MPHLEGRPVTVFAPIAAPEMSSDALDVGASLARDLAEQVFTLCCARPGVSQAQQDRLCDQAEEILAAAVRDLLEAVGTGDPEALRHAQAFTSDAFTARILELCASGRGGDRVQ